MITKRRRPASYFCIDKLSSWRSNVRERRDASKITSLSSITQWPLGRSAHTNGSYTKNIKLTIDRQTKHASLPFTTGMSPALLWNVQRFPTVKKRRSAQRKDALSLRGRKHSLLFGNNWTKMLPLRKRGYGHWPFYAGFSSQQSDILLKAPNSLCPFTSAWLCLV